MIDLTAPQSPSGEQLQATITVAIAAAWFMLVTGGLWHGDGPQDTLGEMLTTRTVHEIPARSP